MARHRCSNCGKSGHKAPTCSANKSNKSISKHKCSNCGKSGHKAPTCSANKSNKSIGKHNCSNCGKSGHKAPTCPRIIKRKAKTKRKIYPSKKGGLRSGYLYVGHHPNFPEWVKIGSTKDLNSREGGFQTSYPDEKFKFTHFHWTSSRRKAENRAQKNAIEKFQRGTGEWFKAKPSDANKIIRKWAREFEQ